MTVSVVIGGDICPTPRDSRLFADGQAQTLFSDLIPVFQSADFSVANLECPIVSSGSPIRKSGKILEAPPGTGATLREVGLGALNLANNHILDHGPSGLESTLAECERESLVVFGAGRNVSEASRVHVYQAGGMRIGFLGLAEREYCIAGPDSPGAAPVGAMEFIQALRKCEADIDHLVVLLHGGREHVPFPPPRLRDLCRFMIEEGAAAVLCQHSHSPGWFEQWGKGLIVYGQGNLLFDPWPDPRPWLYDGYLVKLQFGEEGMSWELLPHEQRGDAIGVRMMTPDAADAMLDGLRRASEQLAIGGALESKWREHCEQRAMLYLGILRGHGRIARKVNALTAYARRLYPDSMMLDLLNVVRCETHREILETVLESEVARRLSKGPGD